MEKYKLEIEIISKRIDITKNKLFVFSAGVAGCWAFISSKYSNYDFLVLLTSLLLFLFAFGVSVNLTKLHILDKELQSIQKRIEK